MRNKKVHFWCSFDPKKVKFWRNVQIFAYIIYIPLLVFFRNPAHSCTFFEFDPRILFTFSTQKTSNLTFFDPSGMVKKVTFFEAGFWNSQLFRPDQFFFKKKVKKTSNLTPPRNWPKKAFFDVSWISTQETQILTFFDVFWDPDRMTHFDRPTRHPTFDHNHNQPPTMSTIQPPTWRQPSPTTNHVDDPTTNNHDRPTTTNDDRQPIDTNRPNHITTIAKVSNNTLQLSRWTTPTSWSIVQLNDVEWLAPDLAQARPTDLRILNSTIDQPPSTQNTKCIFWPPEGVKTPPPAGAGGRQGALIRVFRDQNSKLLTSPRHRLWRPVEPIVCSIFGFSIILSFFSSSG